MISNPKQNPINVQVYIKLQGRIGCRANINRACRDRDGVSLRSMETHQEALEWFLRGAYSVSLWMGEERILMDLTSMSSSFLRYWDAVSSTKIGLS